FSPRMEHLGKDRGARLTGGLQASKGGPSRLSYHIRSVPSLSTIEMSPGYGFTRPKKKLVSSCPEIFFAANDEAWRNSVLGMGRGGRGSAPFLAPRCRSTLDFAKRQALVAIADLDL